jgi:hypothetical protein
MGVGGLIMANHPMAPMGAEAPHREPARSSTRGTSRGFVAPEQHERFAIGEDEGPPGMDRFWAPTSIAGMPNSNYLHNLLRAGWEPAEAKDFPRISGIGEELPAKLVAKGLLSEVLPGDPIEKDGLMLMLRPMELSRRAHQQRERDAYNAVDAQMERLQQTYRPAGRGAGINRRRGQAPMMDTAEE